MTATIPHDCGALSFPPHQAQRHGPTAWGVRTGQGGYTLTLVFRSVLAMAALTLLADQG